MEMLHQDLRPDNVMIDKTGTVKIIDFGSVRVTGVVEAAPPAGRDDILGTAQYTAPEYFLGESGIVALRYLLARRHRLSDADRAAALRRADGDGRARKSQQRKLQYRSALDDDREIPAWIDGVLKKAVHPDPYKRYEELSEFVYDLRHPNADFIDAPPTPLIERNPLLFWKGLSLLLVAVVVALLAVLHGHR